MIVELAAAIERGMALLVTHLHGPSVGRHPSCAKLLRSQGSTISCRAAQLAALRLRAAVVPAAELSPSARGGMDPESGQAQTVISRCRPSWAGSNPAVHGTTVVRQTRAGATA